MDLIYLLAIVLGLLGLVLFWQYQKKVGILGHIPGHKQLIHHHSMLTAVLPRSIAPLKGREVFKDFAKLFAKHDWPPLISVASLHRQQIVVGNADVVRDSMVKKKLPKPTFLYTVLKYFGENIVTADDDGTWKIHRRLLNPAFSDTNLQFVSKITAKNVEKMFHKWDAMATGDKKESVVQVEEDMIELALSVISEAGFGKDINPFQSTSVQSGTSGRMPFKEALVTVSENLVIKLMLPDLILRFSPIPNHRHISKAFRDFTSYMNDIIAARIAEAQKAPRTHSEKSKLENSEETDEGYSDSLGESVRNAVMIDESEKKDLLNLLVQSNLESNSLDDSQLLANVWMFLLAGHETAAHTLTFALGVLGAHPNVQEKMFKEVKEVLGDRKTPVYADYSKLSYCRQVMNETLRMYPVVPGIPKHTTVPLRLDSFDIPANTLIEVSVWSLHRNPKHWKDPESFIPERFENSSQIVPNSFIPFSLGPRSCIGMKFAQVEMTLALAMIAQNYILYYSQPNPDLEKILDSTTILTLKPKKPIRLLAKKRPTEVQ